MSGLTLTARLDPEENRGLMRLSRDTLARNGLLPGDPVRIGGARATHGRAVPGPVADAEVALDAFLARNSGAVEGAPVTLARVDLAPLRSVALRLDAMMRVEPDDLRDGLFDMALTEGDRLRVTLPGGRAADVEIAEVSPEPAGFVTEATTISLVAQSAQPYHGIGGLETQIAQVQEVVAAPLLRPELYERLGLAAPRGILFTGPPGSGKTLLARAVAARTQATFFHIAGPEIVSKHYGESEKALRDVFDAARRAAPAIVFIDEIDAIAPARAGLSDEKQLERRVVAQLLTLLDGLEDRGRVVVMAATNLPDTIDPALRRPGRFDREIAFRPPSPDQRRAILEVHLARAPLAPDADLGAIAALSHGYVGADLAALAREAAVAALSRAVRDAKGEANVALEDLVITQDDLRAGLDATSPSALRGLSSEARPVTWNDIGGLSAARRALDAALLQPRRHPELCAVLGVEPALGVLLAGPPGSGKTLLARALATETGMNFLPVRPPRLLSRYLGDAERAVADIFRTARDTAPTLIFFDEFDALAPRRGGQDAVLDRIVGAASGRARRARRTVRCVRRRGHQPRGRPRPRAHPPGKVRCGRRLRAARCGGTHLDPDRPSRRPPLRARRDGRGDRGGNGRGQRGRSRGPRLRRGARRARPADRGWGSRGRAADHGRGCRVCPRGAARRRDGPRHRPYLRGEPAMANDELIALLAGSDVPHLPDGTTAASAGGFVAIFGAGTPRLANRTRLAAAAAKRMAQLEALMPSGVLLPVMPGTFLAPEELPGMVEANRPMLTRLASELAGKVQFQVTVGRGSAGSHQPPGLAAELAGHLSSLCDACQSLPIDEALVSNHALLLDACREADLDATSGRDRRGESRARDPADRPRARDILRKHPPAPDIPPADPGRAACSRA